MLRRTLGLGLLGLAALSGCSPCLTDATAQVSPEALFHTGRTHLHVAFDTWEHGLGTVAKDASPSAAGVPRTAGCNAPAAAVVECRPCACPPACSVVSCS